MFIGEHIRLTGLKSEDMENLTRWYQDAEFMRQLDSAVAFPRPANQWQKWFETLPDLKNEYHFAIRPLDTETMLGWLAVEGIQWNHRTAWIAIGIGDPASGGTFIGNGVNEGELKKLTEATGGRAFIPIVAVILTARSCNWSRICGSSICWPTSH